ncbi:MAG: DNA repair protein RadC [Clostridiales bacterium]|nr:DNA repair protein RadC [Clostridiales bacterium]
MKEPKICGMNLDKWKESYLDPESVLPEAEELRETAALPGKDREKKINVHEGHREKLRTRFIQENGFEHFEDHQILELLLFYANTRGDTNPIAHALLDEFGSLKNVLEARPEMLMNVKGVGEAAAILISMVVPLTRVWNRCAMAVPTKIGNSREAEKYCLSILAGHRTERFYVIALNAQCNIIGERKISDGSLSEVSAYPRLVMETALNYNAHSVLLCHNHPGGTCAPSAEDISSTLQLQRLLNGVGILVLDHIIVAGSRTYSMIEHGDIDYRLRNR